ncbi:MAG: DNA replication/repair protein RecF [Spirochaetales bacterium]|nr:DNA replication/repair protein RecF [Spirochaetales bacterium]
MAFLTVSTYNFRNLANTETVFSGKNIFLQGTNGQGKTNFLEALYFLSYGTSYRTKNLTEVKEFSKNDFSVIGRFKNNQKDRVKFTYQNGKKEIFLNERKVKDRKDLLSINPLILFSYDDDEIITGSPIKRRKFMDQSICLLFPEYIQKIRKYQRLIEMKNICLRTKKVDIAAIYNREIAELALIITGYRYSFINSIEKRFTDMYRNLTNIEVRLMYKPSVSRHDTAEGFYDFLNSRLNEEVRYGFSLFGPHRDNFIFRSGERSYAAIASTGQRRLLALVLKISQLHYVSMNNDKLPVILIDDVFLELDSGIKLDVMSAIPSYDQAFFTILPQESFFNQISIDDTEIFCIKNGRLEKSEKSI